MVSSSPPRALRWIVFGRHCSRRRSRRHPPSPAQTSMPTSAQTPEASPLPSPPLFHPPSPPSSTDSSRAHIIECIVHSLPADCGVKIGRRAHVLHAWHLRAHSTFVLPGARKLLAPCTAPSPHETPCMWPACAFSLLQSCEGGEEIIISPLVASCKPTTFWFV